MAVNLEALSPPAVVGTRDRILDALVQRVVDLGLQKITMDDIAQRASLSRVTLYSYFPNKQAIVRAAVLRELERFFAELETISAGYEEPEDRLAETFAHAYRSLRTNPLVERMIRSEPEVLANYLARDTPAIPIAREWVARKLEEGGRLRADVDPQQGAELIVRAVHSLVIAPETTFGLDAPGGAQAYARRWLLPLLRA
jgi:AcrR family transcriptional regulator